MDTLSYKTISANKATVTKEWVIVDATDQTLGRLGAQLLGNLYVYAGSEHKHEAQTPKSIDINSLK